MHARLAFVTLACATFILVVAPLEWGLGANCEEVVGLIDVAPERLYPPGEEIPESENTKEGFRSSNELPVWGYREQDGTYWPLMIDGHVGALSFYGARLLYDVGGLHAARAQSAVLAVAALLLIFAFARRVGGERVGIVAVLLAGTSPHLVFIFSMVRPDEQLHSFAHLAAVLCAMTFALSGRSRWLYATALLFGLGLAAKNTALWTLVAVVVTAACFRIVPRARSRDWGIAAALFLLPLIPQILYLALGDSSGAMEQRLAMVASPWTSLSPSGLSSSIATFAAAVGHGGTLVGGHIAGLPNQTPPLPGVGYLLFAGTLVAVLGAFLVSAPRAVRAFGAGFGLLLLQHLAFYYRGESYFELLAPWIPIALAIAGLGLWKAATSLRREAVRRPAQALVIALGLAVFANNGAELARYHEALASPQPSMFELRLQELVADYLEDDEIDPIYTTTYGVIGVYEMYTHGRVRAVHLFPYFRAVADGGPAEYVTQWISILGRLGPGVHYILLSPNPSRVDTSPCRDGNLIANQLWPAVWLLRGQARPVLENQNGRGLRTLIIVRVTLPELATTR